MTGSQVKKYAQEAIDQEEYFIERELDYTEVCEVQIRSSNSLKHKKSQSKFRSFAKHHSSLEEQLSPFDVKKQPTNIESIKKKSGIKPK
jgi:hypothetical protein